MSLLESYLEDCDISQYLRDNFSYPSEEITCNISFKNSKISLCNNDVINTENINALFGKDILLMNGCYITWFKKGNNRFITKYYPLVAFDIYGCDCDVIMGSNMNYVLREELKDYCYRLSNLLGYFKIKRFKCYNNIKNPKGKINFFINIYKENIKNNKYPCEYTKIFDFL